MTNILYPDAEIMQDDDLLKTIKEYSLEIQNINKEMNLLSERKTELLDKMLSRFSDLEILTNVLNKRHLDVTKIK